jgi:hypothetical protein
MTDIFKSMEEMPPKNNSSDVVRVPLTKSERDQMNYVPSSMPTFGRGVQNIERPRRGHGY